MNISMKINPVAEFLVEDEDIDIINKEDIDNNVLKNNTLDSTILKNNTLDSTILNKKATDIKTRDKNHIEQWMKKQIDYIPSTKTTLKHCYDAYKKYLEDDKKIVPLTKKSFSGLFRELLKSKEDEGRVRIYQRSSILIKGVNLKKIEEETKNEKVLIGEKTI